MNGIKYIALLTFAALIINGCSFLNTVNNITEDPYKSLSREDRIFLKYPQISLISEKFDRARAYYYMGDLESTILACNILMNIVDDLNETLDEPDVCSYLDSLSMDIQSLYAKAVDEEIELDSQKQLIAILDSIATNHVVEENIEIKLNWRTKHFIKYFKGPGRRIFRKWLIRAEKYRDIIEPILVEVGVPRDLLYLAVIESGLNLNARSRMRAVGPWQFMRRTAILLGLRINWWIDERKDIVASTYAAAHYLKYLYGLFGSWPLALAAYNAGEYRIAYAISKQKTDDYWKLNLPAQTKWFVPKFMAALEIGRHPEKYGFKNIKAKPIKFDIVQIARSTELKVIAKAAGCSLYRLQKLNPALKRWTTPPDMLVEVKVPEGTAEKCLAVLSSIPPEKRVAWLRHRIRKGETLWQIAQKYEISIKEIKRINKIRNSRRIRPGQILLIPVKDIELSQSNITKPKYKKEPDLPERIRIARYTPPKGYKKVTYIVKDGETLSEIAEKLKVRLSSLRRWNNLRYTSLIHPGDRLVVYIKNETKLNEDLFVEKEKPARGKKIIHIVKRGETLSEISKKYRIKISQILKWNGNIKRDRIFAGDRIVIWLD